MARLLPVYTAVKVPSSVSSASDTNIIWSEDGTLFYSMKNTVMIMTPEPGINLRSTEVVNFTLPKEDTPPLGWMKTMIDMSDREIAFNWNQRCLDWESRSLGSFDLSSSAIAVSPSDMLAGSSCVLATLTTNMDLYLWHAPKNFVTGPWVKVCDVTPFLLETFDKEEPSRLIATLRAQITCIAWSQQANFELSPSPEIDTSFLILGSRAGTLTFLRYTNPECVEHVLTLTVDENWIGRICCSSWSLIAPTTCEAHVAYAASDGSIGIVKVQQRLVKEDDTTSFALGFRLKTTAEKVAPLVYEADLSYTTALRWLEVPERSRILMHCKPGIVHLWSASENGWDGYRCIRLDDPRTFYPVTGVSYLARQDSLILAFLDGSMTAVADVSTNPRSTSQSASTLVTSQKLSAAVDSIIKRSEDEEVYGTATRSGGFIFYTGQGVAAWIHERVSAADFSFTSDAKHNSIFMMAQLYEDNDDNSTIQDLMASTRGTAGPPLSQLRPVFFYFQQPENLARLHQQVLQVLQHPVEDDSAKIILESWMGGLTSELRRDLRSSLRRNLFGWQTIRSLRTKLAFADFAWKVSDDTQRRSGYGQIAQTLLNTISHRNLRTILRHLTAVVSMLTPQDIPFVLRLILQSSLPNCPGDITTDAQALSTSLHSVLSSDSTTQHGLTEHCPACRGEITLQDITTAMCANGHSWARCSVTTFILSSTELRTCIGCTRKAFLPISMTKSPEHLPDMARGWVVQELLEAVHRCLFCGNSFATIL